MHTIYFDELESTNLYAKTHLDELADRTIICAKHQTSGRGRLQRAWLDLGNDNLYMSIILKPNLLNKEIYSNLTQYLSVILCELLETYNLTPQIKWPNDVLVNSKKIAGILSETVIQGSNIKGLVLGIGVNLNVEKENLKRVTDKEVTSLNIEIDKLNSSVYSSSTKNKEEYTDKLNGARINVSEFIDKLLSMFFENYEKFLETGFELIKIDYTKRISFLDKEISVKSFNSVTTGIAKAINDNGELILENNDRQYVLNIGDIL